MSKNKYQFEVPAIRGDAAKSVKDIFKLYHVRPSDSVESTTLGGSGYRALVGDFSLLYWAFYRTSSGELQGAFGLWERGGRLWMTTGSECSVWDFNGQFEPEEVTVEILKHLFVRGTYGSGENSLGIGEDMDLYRADFLDWIDKYVEKKDQEISESFGDGVSLKAGRRGPGIQIDKETLDRLGDLDSGPKN